MDEVLLEETNFTKFLRVCLDRGLTWDEHIVCVPEEAARRRSPQICFSGNTFRDNTGHPPYSYSACDPSPYTKPETMTYSIEHSAVQLEVAETEAPKAP
ncbi:hypothetical protein J6590_075977 [Homalodisca vitripennis]|nr:hypothetical protein J6590_075977 [Homalodisca vitripennis]